MFQEKEFIYNTDNATVIELNPKEFRTQGKTESDNKGKESFKKNNITSINIELNIEEMINKHIII